MKYAELVNFGADMTLASGYSFENNWVKDPLGKKVVCVKNNDANGVYLTEGWGDGDVLKPSQTTSYEGVSITANSSTKISY